MNHVLRDIAGTAQLGWVLGGLTALFLGCFVLWTWWAYSAHSRAAMEEAGRMPLTEGGER